MFTPHEASLSSTHRELLAVLHGLREMAPRLRMQSIVWNTDAQNVVTIIKRGSMIPALASIATDIFLICREHGTVLNMAWVPRADNQMADSLSRLGDADDWRVTADHFQHICCTLGVQPTVDRFASVSNAQLSRFNTIFYSRFAEGTDAFTQRWQGEINWLVPPIYNIPRVLQCPAKQY